VLVQDPAEPETPGSCVRSLGQPNTFLHVITEATSGEEARKRDLGLCGPEWSLYLIGDGPSFVMVVYGIADVAKGLG
jgi:hypothetical protein